MNLYGDDLKEGDVLMTNSPHAGGSQVLLIFSSVPVDPDFPCCRHLPDITIISPVFHPEFKKIIFFTASRGHHADIGGILPGSMPPTSVNIFEEGAEILSFKLVKEGIFDSKGLHEHMIDKPAMYPGSSGCRNIRDVESDLKAVSREYYYMHLWIVENASSKLPPTTKEFNCFTKVRLFSVKLDLGNEMISSLAIHSP